MSCTSWGADVLHQLGCTLGMRLTFPTPLQHKGGHYCQLSTLLMRTEWGLTLVPGLLGALQQQGVAQSGPKEQVVLTQCADLQE